MADLKPCPFCGGEAKVRHYEDIKKDFVSVYQYYVECTNCKTQSGWKANVEDAESEWNTRKPMEAVVAEFEKVLRKETCTKAKCNEYGLCRTCIAHSTIEIVRNGGKE